jgi:hypothetical protein
MGDYNSLKSIEAIAEFSLKAINEQIQKFDWNRKWLEDYKPTEKSEAEKLKSKSQVDQFILLKMFDKNSLAMGKGI